MQKKLLALAVIGAFSGSALADSSVTITGIVKAGWEQYKLKGAAAAENRISDQSSRFILGISEDLGGGLKALAQVDNRFATDLGTLGATGNTFVGLGGGFGQLTFGRNDLHYNEIGSIEGGGHTGSLQTYAGPGIMSQVNGTTVAVGSRSANVIKYDTPNFGGVSATLAASTNFAGNEGNNAVGGTDAAKGKAINGAVRYANGPLKAGLSLWKGEAEGRAATGVDQTGQSLWAGYSFPFGLGVGLGVNRSELKVVGTGAKDKRTAWYLPVSYGMGPHTVLFTYAKAGDVSGTSATGAKFLKLGYEYAFSKRTAMGIHLTKLDNDTAGKYAFFAQSANGTTAPAAGQDAQQVYIGVGHKF